jgi:hypothetical protein
MKCSFVVKRVVVVPEIASDGQRLALRSLLRRYGGAKSVWAIRPYQRMSEPLENRA